jgi:dimethylargininase
VREEHSDPFAIGRGHMPGETMNLIALTREVSASINQCELSFVPREPIDVARARRQHEGYNEQLRRLGLMVVPLPTLDHLPDAVFVEDTAVVVDEVAVAASPGAASRRPEVDSTVEALSRWRRVVRLPAGATLDGGDVVRIGRKFLVGLGARTNQAGVSGLGQQLAPFGYQVTGVPTRDCLHLKTACSALDDRRLLVHRPWIEMAGLKGYELIDVPPHEAWAANALVLGRDIVMPQGYPETRELLELLGFRIHAVDLSELLKAESGVTCSSIILKGDPAPAVA